MVVGELKGKIQVGDAVYMSNFSDDDGEILVTVVLGIEVGQGKAVREAENCRVGLKLEQAGTYPVLLIHTFLLPLWNYFPPHYLYS